MKLNTGISSLKFIFTIVALFIGSVEMKSQVSEIETPYGSMSFSDDDKSTEILGWFALSSGSQKIDSINSMIIIDVASVADGALGELIGSICLMDFINKPYVILSIYNNYGIEKIEPYLEQIAWELCLGSHLQKRYNEFYSRIKKRKDKSINNDRLNIILDTISQKIEDCQQEL